MPKAAKTKKQTPWEKAGVSRSTFYREKSKKRTTRTVARLGATPPAIHQPSAPVPEAPVVTVDDVHRARVADVLAFAATQAPPVDGMCYVVLGGQLRAMFAMLRAGAKNGDDT
jgi:hypothetical protein